MPQPAGLFKGSLEVELFSNVQTGFADLGEAIRLNLVDP